MGNLKEITLEEALKMLAAAKLQIEEQQQQLKTKDDVILKKDFEKLLPWNIKITEFHEERNLEK